MGLARHGSSVVNFIWDCVSGRHVNGLLGALRPNHVHGYYKKRFTRTRSPSPFIIYWIHLGSKWLRHVRAVGGSKNNQVRRWVKVAIKSQPTCSDKRDPISSLPPSHPSP